MINTIEFKISTIEAFKEIYAENREALKYMSEFGTSFEKAVAYMIISVGGIK